MPNGVSGSCNLLSIFHIEKQQWPKYNITENIRVITSCSIHLDVEWANVQQRHSRSNSRRWSRLSKYYFHIASIISASVETNRFVGLIRTTCPDPIRDWFPSFISTLSRWKKSEMLDALGAEWKRFRFVYYLQLHACEGHYLNWVRRVPYTLNYVIQRH